MSTETPRGTRAGSARPGLEPGARNGADAGTRRRPGGRRDARLELLGADTLTDTFTSMADTLATIDVALGTLPDTIGNGMVKTEIQDNARQVAQKVHQAIIAFQFYDKLVQRLDHVCHSLSGLSGLVSDTSRLYNPAAMERAAGTDPLEVHHGRGARHVRRRDGGRHGGGGAQALHGGTHAAGGRQRRRDRAVLSGIQ
jgi:hypothetical protein